MKTKRLIFIISFIFATGIVAGLILAWGLDVLLSRQGGAPGGEILLIPLMGALVYLGYLARQMVEPFQRKEKCNRNVDIRSHNVRVSDRYDSSHHTIRRTREEKRRG